MSANETPIVRFEDILKPNKRPYTLGTTEDANLVGMRLYGKGPFHRELKLASKIRKKSHFVIRKNDVIYNKLFAWKGTFGIVPEELDGMFVSDKFPTYELDEHRVDRIFLQWYFRCSPLWEQARQMSTGSAALSKLTLNPPRFLDLTIPLPSLAKQRIIAAKADRLASKITETLQLREWSAAETTALPQAVLGRIFKRFSKLGPLSRVLRSKPRNGWSPKCDNAEDGTPVLALSAVTGFHYKRKGYKRTSLATSDNTHYWLAPGDLLITRSNSPELVGHAAIYDGSPSPCIYSDLIMKLSTEPKLVDSRFVWCWLQTPLVRDYIKDKAKGSSPTMKKINQGIVMDIPFPEKISLTEQGSILQEFDGLSEKHTELKRLQDESNNELNALLPSILDRAFKGEL